MRRTVPLAIAFTLALGSAVDAQSDLRRTTAGEQPPHHIDVRSADAALPPAWTNVRSTPYPAEALAAGVQGFVVIEATVDDVGSVVDAEALTGPPLLVNVAVENLKLWRFAPNQPGRAVIAYEFSLEGGCARPASLFSLVSARLVRVLACTPHWQAPSIADTDAVIGFHEAVYPRIAQAAMVQGTVIVAIETDTTGRVAQASALAGPDMLVKAALDNVRQWSFAPGDERRTAVIYDFRFERGCFGYQSRFRLRDTGVAFIATCPNPVMFTSGHRMDAAPDEP